MRAIIGLLSLQATMRYIVDAHGKTHVSMAILVTNLVLTIILFRLLIFGAGPIPAMGGIGTGYAITIASWLSFLLFVGVLQWMEPFRSYRPQSDLLKKWLSGYADIIAVITLPEAAFGNKHNMKSIFVLKKQTKNAPETFVYPLSDLQNPEVLKDFTENFQNWKSDNSIF